jgi:Cu/Ag efflux protein CusF
MKRISLLAAILMAAGPLPVGADDAHHKAAPTIVAASTQLAEGEVRKVDKDAKKITLRHGPIPNLDMPAMSMVFQVKDPAMLEQVKAGDKVRFQAEKTAGQYTVTHIEPAK